MKRNLSKHKGKHNIIVLQGTLRNSEAKRRKLTAVRAELDGDNKFTIGEHDRRQKPTKKLHIVVIEDGEEASPPNGTEVDFKGDVWIEHEKKNIAVCR